MSGVYHNARAAEMSVCRGLAHDGTVTAKLPGYVSARDLAAASLPGLPTTHSAIVRRAAADGWTYIDRVGRGGGRLYRTADLPAEAQQALSHRRISAARAAPIGRPSGTDYFSRNPDVAAAVELILTRRARALSATIVMELLAEEFVRLPSLRSLQRFISRLEAERKVLLTAFRDPDAYKSKYRLALGRADANTDHAHQIWEIDTTPADVMTTDGRKMVLQVIDRWSRRARFMVCESESAQSVRRLLTTTITAWGVMPECVMTDQGSGFINASIVSALELLGIDHWPCPPGSPEKKPHVERLFGTFTRARAELFDGYIGHNVAEAQKLRARARADSGRPVIVARMSAADLQTALDAWVDGVYHLRDHGTLRMSPMRKWQSSPVPARAAPPADLLRMALSADVGVRTVGKRGIVWQHGRYWSPSLSAWVGRQVRVRRDEDELGELLIFTPDGLFIDIAVNAGRSGLSEAEFAIEAKAAQAQWLREQRADLKARTRDFSFERARDARLRRDAEEAGKLAHFPTPTVPHATPTLDTLADARATAAPLPAQPATRPVAAILPLPQSPAARMREADALIARAAAGEPVDADALRRARLYVTTSEYRAQRMVADHLAAPSSQSTSA